MIIQTNGFIKTKGADFYKVLIMNKLLKHRKAVRKFLEDKKCLCYNV